MKINWIKLYNRLFEIINQSGKDCYYTGSRFLDEIRTINYSVPSYSAYIENRKKEQVSTSRRDYFYELVMEQNEKDRINLFKNILQKTKECEPEKTRELLSEITQCDIAKIKVAVPNNLWNSDRLTEYIEKMDTSITENNYDYTLTLAYTCLEGFYKTFLTEKKIELVNDKINSLSKQVKDEIKKELDDNNLKYPKNILHLISTVTSAISNARNNFSDSHSGNKAEKWLAIYVRDNVNSIIKLLLNFLPNVNQNIGYNYSSSEVFGVGTNY